MKVLDAVRITIGGGILVVTCVAVGALLYQVHSSPAPLDVDYSELLMEPQWTPPDLPPCYQRANDPSRTDVIGHWSDGPSLGPVGIIIYETGRYRSSHSGCFGTYETVVGSWSFDEGVVLLSDGMPFGNDGLVVVVDEDQLALLPFDSSDWLWPLHRMANPK